MNADGAQIPADKLYIAGNYVEDAAEVKPALTLEAFRIGNLGCFDGPGHSGQKRTLAIMGPGSETSSGAPCGKRPALEDGAASSAPSARTPAPSGCASSVAGSAGEMASATASRRRSSARLLSRSAPAPPRPDDSSPLALEGGRPDESVVGSAATTSESAMVEEPEAAMVQDAPPFDAEEADFGDSRDFLGAEDESGGEDCESGACAQPAT